jgi:hypothetical protein
MDDYELSDAQAIDGWMYGEGSDDYMEGSRSENTTYKDKLLGGPGPVLNTLDFPIYDKPAI